MAPGSSAAFAVAAASAQVKVRVDAVSADPSTLRAMRDRQQQTDQRLSKLLQEHDATEGKRLQAVRRRQRLLQKAVSTPGLPAAVYPCSYWLAGLYTKEGWEATVLLCWQQLAVRYRSNCTQDSTGTNGGACKPC